MDLGKAMKLIKTALKKGNYNETDYYKYQCEDRKLNITKLKEFYKKCHILGIVYQGEVDHKGHCYKITLKYEKNKDLNLALILLKDGKLRFKTVFPSEVKRRVKK